MSSKQPSNDTATEASKAAAVPMRLEAVVVPVADVDRAKRFYQRLGWRVDVDVSAGDDYRLMHITPPASNASILFGKGVTSAPPGSIDSLVLAVDDIEAARDELLSQGVGVSDVFHDAGGGPPAALSPTPTRAPRARIPKPVPTPRMHPSAIPTATAGCCRRSRSGPRAGSDG
jgi:catechol 2,3-dioxygenase-like lactoylglutathione lyase family enzyme